MNVLMFAWNGVAAVALAMMPPVVMQGGGTPGPAGPSRPNVEAGPNGPNKPSAGPQDSEVVTRVYDLSSLKRMAPSYDEDRAAIWLPIRRAGLSENVGNEYQGNVEEFMGLFQDIHYRELEKVDRRVTRLEGDRWLLRMPQSMHQEFQRLAGFYEQLIAAHTQLQVDVLSSLPQGMDSQVLMPNEQADAWIQQAQEGGAVHSSYTIQVPLGELGSFSSQVKREFINVAEIQIAQGSVMTYSRTEAYRSGEFGVFTAKPEGNGMRISAAWVVSDTPDSEPLGAGIMALIGSQNSAAEMVPLDGILDMTKQWARGVSSNALLQPGQAWVTSVAGDGATLGAAVLVRVLSAPVIESTYTSDGTVPYVLHATPQALLRETSIRVPQCKEWSDWGWSPVRKQRDTEWLSLRAETTGDELGEYLGNSSEGDLVESWSGEYLRVLRTSMSEGYGFEAKRAELTRLAQGMNSITPIAAQYEVKVYSQTGLGEPTLLGSTVVSRGYPGHLVRAREHGELYGYDCEVAQSAAVQVPEVLYSIEGVILDLQVFPFSDDNLRLSVDGVFRVPVSKREVDFGSPLQRPYTRLNYRSVDLKQSRILSADPAGVYRTHIGAKGQAAMGLVFEVTQL